MKNESEACIPLESRNSGAATSSERTAQLESWIDNVIVPILVQTILKARRKVGEDIGVVSDQS